jgi:VCBS repeat-containing protein
VKVFVAYGTGVVRGQIKVAGGTLTNDSFIFVSMSRQGEPERTAERYSAQADSRGNFTIRGIRAGTYDIALQINSMGSQPLPRGFSRVQRQTVTVTDGAVSEVIFNIDLTRKEEP